MQNIKNLILTIFLTITIFVNPVSNKLYGEDAKEAQQFVATILGDIYAFLPKHKDNKEIYPYFEQLTKDKFDIDYLAMWSLGQYGRKMDDKLKQEYLAIARRYMVLSYGSVFQKYYAEYKYKITGAEVLDDNSYAVKFFIESKKNSKKQDNTITAYWKIVQKNGYKVGDIVVNGVSLANAQRFEFERDIKAKNGDLALFIKELDAQVLANEKVLGIK